MILRTVAAIALTLGALVVRAQPPSTVNPFTGLPDVQPGQSAEAAPNLSPAPASSRNDAKARTTAAPSAAGPVKVRANTAKPRSMRPASVKQASVPAAAQPALNLVSVVRTGARATALFAADGGLIRVTAAADEASARLAIANLREVALDGRPYRIAGGRLTRFIAPDARLASPRLCLSMSARGTR